MTDCNGKQIVVGARIKYYPIGARELYIGNVKYFEVDTPGLSDNSDLDFGYILIDCRRTGSLY